MICLDLQPYSIVNDVGFREFIPFLEAQVQAANTSATVI
jgi:hypothetical protein